MKLARMDLLRATDALTSAHAALEIATELESPRLQVQAMQLLVKESWLRRALGGQRNFDKKYIRFLFEGVQAAAVSTRLERMGKVKTILLHLLFANNLSLFPDDLGRGGSEIETPQQN